MKRKVVFRLAAVAGGGALVKKYVDEPKANEDELSRDWKPEAMEEYWLKSRPMHTIGRGLHVAKVFLPLAIGCGIDHGLGRLSNSTETRRGRAVELREALTELGPAFIKLGQALSIRPDVLPIEAIEELRTLCDAVPEVSTTTALELMQKELNGIDPIQLFSGLERHTKPIAAASLGQVYKAQLDGHDVAIKIQRPDIIATVSLDLTLLRLWARFVQHAKKYLVPRQRPYDIALIDAFAQGAWNELDYCAEAKNQIEMREALLKASSRRLRTQVTIPTVRLATRKLLVTDWVHGDQLCRSSPDTIKRLVPIGVELFLWQLLDFGEYHCDPHAGNLLVDQAGRLALIDFGLCCHIERPSTQAMTKAIVHLIQGDVVALLDDAIILDFLPPDVDRDSLLPVLKRVFDEAQLAANSFQANDRRFASVHRRRKEFYAVSNDLNSIFFEYPFSVPDYFALITRALIILEGIALTGDPDFDIFNAAYPFALRRAKELFGDSLTDLAFALHQRRNHLSGLPSSNNQNEKRRRWWWFLSSSSSSSSSSPSVVV